MAARELVWVCVAAVAAAGCGSVFDSERCEDDGCPAPPAAPRGEAPPSGSAPSEPTGPGDGQGPAEGTVSDLGSAPGAACATPDRPRAGQSGAVVERYFSPPQVVADEIDCRVLASGDVIPVERFNAALWQLGATADDTPISWDVGSLTGLAVGSTPTERALYQRGPSDTPNTHAIQLRGDGFGVYLNGRPATGDVLPGVAHYDFPLDAAPRPFVHGDSELAYTLDLQVPTAARSGGAEVYAAAVLRLRDARLGNEGRQLWFSIQAFDLRPPQSEDVIIDGCSTCSQWPIITTTFADDMRFGHLAPGSARFSSEPWSGFRHFDFRVGAPELAAALARAKERYGLTDRQLSPDPADYALVHFNVNPEVYAPPGATGRIGASARGIGLARVALRSEPPLPYVGRVLVSAANDVHTPSVAQTAQLFFVTQEDPVWDEAKSLRAALPNDGANHELVFDFAAHPEWRGTVTGLRFDPFDCVSKPACNAACFNVDYLAVQIGEASVARWDFSGPEAWPIANPFQGWSFAAIASTWTSSGYFGGCVDPSREVGAGYGDPWVKRSDLLVATGR